MSEDIPGGSKVLAVNLQLAEYPILARKVREQMRHELFTRGVISRQQFEDEVLKKAIRTQKKEGLSDPFGQESAQEWDERVRIIRDYLTDFYFAVNFRYEHFEELFLGVLQERTPGQDIVLTFNPELAPWSMLFAQGEEYEQLPPEDKPRIRHHQRQINVVLIRGMISDQLDFMGVAREHLDIWDLKEIYQRRFGQGKIGGKAAGMMLAYKILREPDPQDPFPITPYITIPDSYFIGADVFYAFVAHNELYPYFDQKYKEREQIEADYPETYERFTQGRFPEGVINELTGLMERLGPGPLIVRSSSLLEDNFGKSFAGKYTSFFCPNQGTPAENLDAVLDAIRRVYASILNPDALCYRRQVGLLDYDERMAILIQRVVGASHGRYFFPTVGGVAFGRNPFRWNRQIRREDGFMRIVWGLGTRAVDRVSNDYPRMVALSHPHLRPEITAAEIRKYSQHFIDVLDLEDNVRRTLPVAEIITSGFPGIEMLASLDEGDYIKPLVYRDTSVPPEQLVLTFNRLFQDKTFIALMQAMLRKLERAYGWPVDIEFAIDIAPRSSKLPFRIHLLQCRPLSSPKDESPGHQIPAYVPAQDVLFTSGHLVPEGIVSSIEYVVYVDPLRYAHISDHVVQSEIGRIIGRLNKKLAGRRYILMGPGRWGSANIDLGVPVSYADIYNTAMLVEIAFAGADGTPEVSYGTHFFQDLVETNIYPLSLYPDRADTVFNQSFFDQAPNALSDLLPQDAANAQFVKVIDVRAVSGGRLLQVIMSAEEERAIAYLQDAP